MVVGSSPTVGVLSACGNNRRAAVRRYIEHVSAPHVFDRNRAGAKKHAYNGLLLCVSGAAGIPGHYAYAKNVWRARHEGNLKSIC